MKEKKPFFTVFLVLGGLVFGFFVFYVATKEADRGQQIEKEIDNLKNESEKIQRSNQELAEKISYFETPAFREKTAKEKLNLQKPEEKVVVIKPSPSDILEAKENIEIKESDTSAKDIPNYKKWWNHFFEY